MRARRLRGWLLRLVLNRPLAVSLGAALATPAAIVLSRDFRWESAITDGMALVMFATGVALMWAGLTGRRPDWIE
jgi:hypothetical protein